MAPGCSVGSVSPTSVEFSVIVCGEESRASPGKTMKISQTKGSDLGSKIDGPGMTGIKNIRCLAVDGCPRAGQRLDGVRVMEAKPSNLLHDVLSRGYMPASTQVLPVAIDDGPVGVSHFAEVQQRKFIIGPRDVPKPVDDG